MAELRWVCPDRIGVDRHNQDQIEAFCAWKCFHLARLEVTGAEAGGWEDGPRASTRSRCFARAVHPVP